MLRMIKVTGESLSPLFLEGDYVLITTIPFMICKIKPGDTIVFQHPFYGMLIKQVESASPDQGSISVIGLIPIASIAGASAQFKGKMLWGK